MACRATELLDDSYHAQLAKLIRISRPKVDLSEHIRLAGDAGSGGDVMSAFAGTRPAGRGRQDGQQAAVGFLRACGR